MSYNSLLSQLMADWSDKTAVGLLGEYEMVSQSISALTTTPQPILVQHAVLGLLRNLSVPMANKAIIQSRGFLANIMTMAPWQEKFDVAKSIQASGVAIVKNLCRDEGQYLSPSSPLTYTLRSRMCGLRGRSSINTKALQLP